jgi:hypothetical protein
MREPDFNSLKERLLRNGVAPKHVRRTIAELKDHHTDLFSEALARGHSVEEAAPEASIRLGDEDMLAAEVIARPELRSFAYRWPWVAYGLTPIVLFVAGLAGLVVLLWLATKGSIPDYYTFVRRWGAPDASRSPSGAIRLFYMLGVPLVLGGVCCVLAGRRRAALGWPVLGVVLLSIITAVHQLDVCWPQGPNATGGLCMAVSVIPPIHNFGITVLRAVASCALTLGPYLWWRTRLAH